MEWNLSDAKNRLTEVVNRTLSEGPQVMRRRRHPVVVIAPDQYDKMAGKKPGFKEYLHEGSSFEGLEWKQDPGAAMDVEL